jgi:hypothetical protein
VVSGPIWIAAGNSPNSDIWRLLIDNGLLGQGKEVREASLRILANDMLRADVPRIEILEVLFQHGLVVSDNILSMAITKADPDTVQYLVSKFDPGHTYSNGALISAACFNNTRVVEILIDSGMDVNCEVAITDHFDFRASAFPLGAAAGAGNGDVVKLLVERGALKENRDSHGRTAADRAVENGHLEIAEFLSEPTWGRATAVTL